MRFSVSNSCPIAAQLGVYLAGNAFKCSEIVCKDAEKLSKKIVREQTAFLRNNLRQHENENLEFVI